MADAENSFPARARGAARHGPGALGTISGGRLGTLLLLAAASWLLAQTAASQPKQASAATSLYTRADTNATTVWSPRTQVAGQIGDATSVDAVYAVDAWTSASIDIVTAATAAVHEVRHELNGGVTHAWHDLSLAASYRYSTEKDYWSHGGVIQAALDLAHKNTTLALSLFGSRDTVGHALDQGFRELQFTLGGRLSLLQLLDRDSWAQLAWESLFVGGYQASPYRFVATGGQGTCASAAPYCSPEYVPDERYRHALVGRLRRAFGPRVSAGLEYRFYFDSWDLFSQTLAPSLAWLPVAHGTLSLDYRYYTQGEASFYQPRYFGSAQSIGYLTRDKELSALFSQRLGLQYLHEFELAGGRVLLSAAARASVTRIRYLAYVGLSRVDALETTLVLGLDLR